MFNDPLANIPDPIIWTVATDPPPGQRQGKPKRSRRRRANDRDALDIPDKKFDWIGASIIACFAALLITASAFLCYVTAAIRRDIAQFNQMEQQRKGHDAATKAK
jgi:hypothetical protein